MPAAMLRLTPLILLLAACDDTGSQPGPGGVTIGEAKALDDAATMLEEQGKAEAEFAPAAEK